MARSYPKNRYSYNGLTKQFPSEYDSWSGMFRRCRPGKDYALRGIKVCKRWSSFALFLQDMGPKPGPGFEIDRKDNDGNYAPSNCRWATRKQQCRNTRRNRLITYNGQTRCVSEWAEVFGISEKVLSRRIRLGWTGARLFDKQDGRSTRTDRKQKNNVLITCAGVTKTRTEWSKETGLNTSTIAYRLSIGMSPEEALNPDRFKPYGAKHRRTD